MSDVGTLWVHRPLVNWLDVYRWGIEAGFDLMFTPSTLHVSVATCRHATDLSNLGPLDGGRLVVGGGERRVARLGNNGAQCLLFESPELVERHRAIAVNVPIDHGDQGLNPHMTLCRHRHQTFEPTHAYEGELVFGPEVLGRFVPNFRIQQRAVNGNDVRKLLDLPLLEKKSSNARSYDQHAMEQKKRRQDKARIREDLDDLLGDDEWIRRQVSKRL